MVDAATMIAKPAIATTIQIMLPLTAITCAGSEPLPFDAWAEEEEDPGKSVSNVVCRTAKRVCRDPYSY
jgi:hypothetical protein